MDFSQVSEAVTELEILNDARLKVGTNANAPANLVLNNTVFQHIYNGVGESIRINGVIVTTRKLLKNGRTKGVNARYKVGLIVKTQKLYLGSLQLGHVSLTHVPMRRPNRVTAAPNESNPVQVQNMYFENAISDNDLVPNLLQWEQLSNT